MHKTSVSRAAILLAGVIVVTIGCSNSTSGDLPPTGRLEIAVTGPPGGTAVVTVSGPSGSRTISETTTLTGLLPGSYTITPNNVQVGSRTYGSWPASQAVNVVSYLAPAKDSVTYVLMNATLDLTVAGLPGGLPAAVLITGPDSSVVATGSQTLTIVPGTYLITARPVTQAGVMYGGTLAFQIELPPSFVAVPAAVTYAAVPTGTLIVRVSGPFSRPNYPVVLVAGPYNYVHTVTTSLSVAEVPLGTLSVRGARRCFVGVPGSGSCFSSTGYYGYFYYAHPQTQDVALTSASPSATVSVRYTSP